MNKQEMKAAAKALAANRLLPMILAQRRDEIFETWQQCEEPERREQLWFSLRQLDQLAGAIEDAIREYGGSRSD